MSSAAYHTLRGCRINISAMHTSIHSLELALALAQLLLLMKHGGLLLLLLLLLLGMILLLLRLSNLESELVLVRMDARLIADCKLSIRPLDQIIVRQMFWIIIIVVLSVVYSCCGCVPAMVGILAIAFTPRRDRYVLLLLRMVAVRVCMLTLVVGRCSSSGGVLIEVVVHFLVILCLFRDG